VFGLGILLIFLFRLPYEKPPNATAPIPQTGARPDTLRPALAGALLSNGGVALQHAMATVFGLADRGDLTINEEPRKWGQRQFTITRVATNHARHPEEEAVLALAFADSVRRGETVLLSKARTRIASRLRPFRAAIHHELRTLGLLDNERMHARSRMLRLAAMLLALAALLIVPAAVLAREFGGWPFLVVGAAAGAAVVGFIAFGAMTPLSNEGGRRAQAWRAYRKYLGNVARERVPFSGPTPATLLAYAVALNLASVWSRLVKRQPAMVPPWYRALAASGADGGDDGFAAFVAYGGAGADGGGGGGAGGAAGGGGSGAG
jgi:hypothetical protein